jgi:hypothetical protein
VGIAWRPPIRGRYSGRWERIATLEGASFNDAKAPSGLLCYRVRAITDAGETAFSNIARIRR